MQRLEQLVSAKEAENEDLKADLHSIAKEHTSVQRQLEAMQEYFDSVKNIEVVER